MSLKYVNILDLKHRYGRLQNETKISNWDNRAKHIMRKAAEKADLCSHPKQLRLALEPEGASLVCRKEKLKSDGEQLGAGLSNSLCSILIMFLGTAYMVVDAGGGVFFCANGGRIISFFQELLTLGACFVRLFASSKELLQKNGRNPFDAFPVEICFFKCATH